MDLRLIPEYDGGTETSVTEWLEKAELVCKLRGVTEELHEVIPLRLTGGAFAVFQQLPEGDKKNVAKIKAALKAAFAHDPFVAYDRFINRKLLPFESADVYLAELRRHSSLFGGISDTGLGCAFVAGLPEDVRQILRAGCRVESLSLDQLLARVRAVLADHGGVTCGPGAAMVAKRLPSPVKDKQKVRSTRNHQNTGERRCYVCQELNHLAKDCLVRKQQAEGRGPMKCFRCGGPHPVKFCPGNWSGEGSAPVFSPSGQ